MTAVLLGHLKSFRGAGHGEDQKKWFEFSASTNPRFLGRYLFTVNDGKQARKVSITYADVALLTALFIRGSCAVLKLNEGSALRSVARMAESYGYAVPAHAMGSTPGAPDAPAGAPDAAPPALLGRTSRGHGAPAAAHG